ncbi:MAG TPA: S1 family peptidase [Solirubrobacteraceae bacterium]|nr:S1 family peptidase [Solirubrobacteraceae bacterium]
MLTAALLVPAPAGAIVGGVPDGNGHPAVGLLAFDVDGTGETPPFALCTGVVISDHAFLTAAHCIAAIPGAAWAVTLEGGAPGDPVTTTGFFPDDFPFAIIGPVHRATTAIVHPDFGGGVSRENDVAVVLFPDGTFAGVTPVSLPAPGSLDGAAGRSVTLVGYGTDATLGPPRHSYAGIRQTATAGVQTITARWLRLAPGAAALCYGDSGSPQFLGARSNVAVSVWSHHATTCEGSSRAQRLDVAPVRVFLAPFL